MGTKWEWDTYRNKMPMVCVAKNWGIVRRVYAFVLFQSTKLLDPTLFYKPIQPPSAKKTTVSPISLWLQLHVCRSFQEKKQIKI